jgi:hypothetical protein
MNQCLAAVLHLCCPLMPDSGHPFNATRGNQGASLSSASAQYNIQPLAHVFMHMCADDQGPDGQEVRLTMARRRGQGLRIRNHI